MVQLLLAHGANPSSRDHNGTAADTFARQVGNHAAAMAIAHVRGTFTPASVSGLLRRPLACVQKCSLPATASSDVMTYRAYRAIK